MSTIDPTTLDVTKPEQGEATTASVRANEVATQNNLQAAKNDIEALETGKADQTALDAHTGDGTIHFTEASIDHTGIANVGTNTHAQIDGHIASSANPHGVTAAQAGADPAGSADAVQTNLDAHRGAGGAVEHPVTVVGTPGFAPALSGNATQYLDGSGAFSTPAGGGTGDGTYNETTKDGASVSTGRAILEFRDTGDATVTVTDDAGGDRTIISIDASAGAGGGGVGAGSPFVVGDLTMVESAAGDGSIHTVAAGLSGAEVRTHLDTAGIHFTEASIDHASIQNVGTNTHAQIDSHLADTSGTPHDIGGQITTAITAHEGAVDPHAGVYLKKVDEDATPQLGGPLETQGNNILLQDGTTTEGVLGALAAQTGAVLAYSDDGTYQLGDGAITVEPGAVGVYGSTVVVDALTHSLDGGRQVYVAENGSLFAVDPPDPGWSVFDSDAADYDLTSGTGTGAWVNLTGLTVMTPQDVEIDDRLDYSVTLYVSNASNQSGTIDVGFSVNDAVGPPTLGASISISAGFVGIAPVAFSAVAAQAYAAGADVDVWARRNNGTGPQYDPNLLGTVTPHEFVLSTPGTGGGGTGDGDVLQGAGWTDGALLISQSAAGKIAGGTSIQSADVQTRIGTPTADNLVSMDAGGLVQDAGVSVADLGSVTVSDTPPPTPSGGDQWYRSTDGRMAVYYEDGSSSQWVESGPGAVNSGGGMAWFADIDLGGLTEYIFALDASYDYEFWVNHRPILTDSALSLDLGVSGIGGPWLSNQSSVFDGQASTTATSTIATGSPLIGTDQSASASEFHASQFFYLNNHGDPNWRTSIFGEYYNQTAAGTVQSYRHWTFSANVEAHNAMRLYWDNGSAWAANSVIRINRRLRG